MPASLVYLFDDDDKDILFMKERWGDDLKMFHPDYVRRYWPGSGGDCGGWDNLIILGTNSDLLKEYWAHLEEHCQKLLSSWTPEHKDKIRFVFNALIHKAKELEKENAKNDDLPNYLNEYYGQLDKILNRVPQNKPLSVNQLTPEYQAIHTALLKLVHYSNAQSLIEELANVDSASPVLPHHFLAASTELFIEKMGLSPEHKLKTLMTPLFYLSVLSAETMALDCQGKSSKDNRVKSIDKFIFLEQMGGKNTLSYCTLMRDFYFKGWIYHYVNENKGVKKNKVYGDLLKNYDVLIDALPESVKGSLPKAVPKGIEKKYISKLLTQIQVNGSLIGRYEEMSEIVRKSVKEPPKLSDMEKRIVSFFSGVT